MLSHITKSSFSFRSFAKLYAQTHEWIEISGDIGTVGISAHAAHQLGDVVFADAQKKEGVKAGEEVANLESVKTTSAVYAPMDGSVVEVNTKLQDDPGLVNKSPEKDGWICKLKLSNPSSTSHLMDENAYNVKLRS